MIKCPCVQKQVDLGFPILATLYKHALQPNAHTLAILLHGLRMEGSMAAVIELFQDIYSREKKHFQNEST